MSGCTSFWCVTQHSYGDDDNNNDQRKKSVQSGRFGWNRAAIKPAHNAAERIEGQDKNPETGGQDDHYNRTKSQVPLESSQLSAVRALNHLHGNTSDGRISRT
jgi:hypothetical protein